MPVLPDDGCARLPILPAKTAAMPEARDWASRIPAAALARSVILVEGSRESTIRTDSGTAAGKGRGKPWTSGHQL